MRQRVRPRRHRQHRRVDQRVVDDPPQRRLGVRELPGRREVRQRIELRAGWPSRRARGSSSAESDGRRAGRKGARVVASGRLQGMTASHTEPESLLAARERWVARGVSAPAIVAVSADGAHVAGRRRRPLPRLRRRHRLPEPGPQPGGGGRGDPRPGRRLPAPVLHGRRLRALRRRLPQARRALALPRRRPEVDPVQLGRRGRRERGQDRPRRDRPPGDRQLRPRLPRPHADDDDADQQGQALQEGLRAVRPRGLPRARAVPLPRHLAATTASPRSSSSSSPTSTRPRSPR